MKHKKRPRPYDPPHPWTPYPLQKMSTEEVGPLLWIPQVLKVAPSVPAQPFKYGVPVEVDEETEEFLHARYTWLTLTWFIERGEEKDTFLPTADCKVQLHGTDDSHFGAFLIRRDASEFMETWDTLMLFLSDSGAHTLALNGEYLLDYADSSLGAYERDYN